MDKKITAWWQAHKPTKCRLIQVYAALLYNANIKGFIQGEIYTGQVKNICVPGFNCYSCPGAVGACPLGAMQNALASSGNRAPFYVLGILMIFGLTLGRTICGWLCPLGMIQELLHKIPTPKIRKNRVTHMLSYMKYVILAIFVIIIPLVYAMQHLPVPAFCKYICPAGTLEGAMGLLSNPANASKFSMLGILFTRKFIIMILIFTGCVFVYRAFCRFLCPLGAIYGCFAKLSVLGVKVEASKCTNCGRCINICKMDIQHVGDHECINCGECIQECPHQALSIKCGKITLMEKKTADTEKAKHLPVRIIWGIALLVLIGALVYFNFMAPQNRSFTDANSKQETVSDTTVNTASSGSANDTLNTASNAKSVGYEVGMRCPDFTVPLYNTEGETFSTEASAGKIMVINFWATWCTPCVGELPYFQQLYDHYGNEVEVIAIHSDMITDDVQEYLDEQPYTFMLGQDEDGSVISSLGGSTLLPMTVVVDQNGEIVYNKTGSVTYEKLESLVEPLRKE